MSGRARKHSYRIVGGPLDGEVYDDVADKDMEGLRKANKGEGLELVPSPGEPGGDEPRDDPRNTPLYDATIGDAEIDAPRFDATIGDVVMEPSFSGPVEIDPFGVNDRDHAGDAGPSRPARDPALYGDAPSYQPGWDPDFIETALDASIGAVQGATGGGADEFINWLDPYAGEMYRTEMNLARERSPWAYHLAQGAAGTPSALVGGPGITGIATQMGLGALQGGLSAEGDLGERAWGAARGAGTAGALHGVGEGVELAARGGRWAQPLWQSASNEARNAVFGEPGDFRRLADKRGLDYAFDEPSAIVKELDMTNAFVPQSARSYANKARATKENIGADLGANLHEAGADVGTHVSRDMPRQMGANMEVPMPPPPVEGTAESMLADELLGPQPELLTAPALRQSPEPSVAGELYRLEQSAPDGTDIGNSMSNAYGKLRSLLPEAVPPMLTPQRLNELKSAYQDQAYEAGKAGDMPSSIAEKSAAGAARGMNDLLQGALAEHPDLQHAIRHQKLAKSYGDAATIEEMATNKAAGSQGQQAATGLWGTVTAPITRAVKKWGPDLTANVTQGLASGAKSVGSIDPAFGQASREAAAFAHAPLVQEAGRGPARVSDTVLSMLESGPEQLGPYAQRLQQAASSPSPTAIDDEITRLIQTDSDFRIYVLPMLRPGSRG